MGESLLSPRRIRAAERQRQALELRKAGVTFEDIAKQLGFRSKSSAYAAIKSALQKTLQLPADEVRALEVERLDALLLAIWPEVKRGNLAAINCALRIMERRARLLGLDAPVQYSGETITRHVFNHETVSAAIASRSSSYSDAPGAGAVGSDGETVGEELHGRRV